MVPLEHKLAAAVGFLQHRVAGDVALPRVGGKLHPFGLVHEQLGKPFHELDFSQSG